MSADEAARVDLFLTIAIPLLPVFWIILALQTRWLKTTLRSATVQWIRHGGHRRSKGNLRATLWASAIAICFVYGSVAEALSLVAILFGWQAMEKLAAAQLLIALILAIGLSVWVLLVQVAARVDTVTPDEKEG